MWQHDWQSRGCGVKSCYAQEQRHRQHRPPSSQTSLITVWLLPAQNNSHTILYKHTFKQPSHNISMMPSSRLVQLKAVTHFTCHTWILLLLPKLLCFCLSWLGSPSAHYRKSLNRSPGFYQYNQVRPLACNRGVVSFEGPACISKSTTKMTAGNMTARQLV